MANKPKVIFCFCTGSCPTMRNIDIWELANYARLELDIEYGVVHAMLCGPEDGYAFLRDLLKDPNGKYITFACAPEAQRKLFKRALEGSGLDLEKQWFPINIKNLTTEEAKKLLAETVEKVKNMEEVNP